MAVTGWKRFSISAAGVPAHLYLGGSLYVAFKVTGCHALPGMHGALPDFVVTHFWGAPSKGADPGFSAHVSPLAAGARGEACDPGSGGVSGHTRSESLAVCVQAEGLRWGQDRNCCAVP